MQLQIASSKNPQTWWETYFLRMMERILAKAKPHYLKITHKFGIIIPNTV